MKKINFVSVLVALVLCLGMASLAWASWSEAPANPPNDNAAAPLNTSALSQMKEGSLAIGGWLDVLQLFKSGWARLGGNNDGEFWRLGINGPMIQRDGLVSLANGEDSRVGIGTTEPSVGHYALKLDVEGAAGAGAYCDNNGQNCFTASQVAITLNGGNTGGSTTTPPSSSTFQGQFTHHLIWYNNGSYAWNGDAGGATWTKQAPGVDGLPETIKLICPAGSKIVSGGGSCRYSQGYMAYSTVVINQASKYGDEAWFFGCMGNNSLFFGYSWDFVASADIICAK